VTTRRGLDWLIGFTDYLYTPHRTTGNYSAIANLHNSQFTTARAKPFPACCVFISAVLRQRLQQCRLFSLPRLRRSFTGSRTGLLARYFLRNSQSNSLLQLPTIPLSSVLSYSANCQLQRLPQFNSSAHKLITWQAGVSKVN
jgi:hypothetical protein